MSDGFGFSRAEGGSRTVRLLPAQLALIARAEYIQLELRKAVARESELASGNQLELREGTADQIQTALTSQLAKVGFDDQYSLTEEGDEIEALIEALQGGVSTSFNGFDQ